MNFKLARLSLLAAGIALATAACGARSADPAFVTRQAPPLMSLSAPPAPGPARDYVLPTAQTRTLDNGLRITLIDRPEFPSLAIRLVVHAGTASVPGGISSVPLLLRSLREGAGDLSADDIAERLDRAGIAWGSGVNDDTITLSADTIATQGTEALQLLGLIASSPTFPLDRLQARRTELVGEIALAQARPEFHVGIATRRAIFPADHPFSRDVTTAAELEALDLNALAALWPKLAGPAWSELIVVGALPQGLDAVIDQAFGGWSSAHAAPADALPVQISGCREAHVVLREASAQTSIVWVGPGIRNGAPEWMPSLVANQVLGGGPSARLFLNLREDKSYTYGAYSTFEAWGPGVFRAYAAVRPEVTLDAAREFLVEFERFESDALDDLAGAQAYLSGVFPIELQTNAQLAGRIARLVGERLPLSTLETWREEIQEVEEAQARRAAARFLNTDQLTLILVGDAEVTLPTALALGSRVHVYNTDGELVETREGEVSLPCSPSDSALP